MPNKSTDGIPRPHLISALLGLATAVTNFGALAIEPRYLLAFGDIFLFLAAATMGLRGTIIAISVALASQYFVIPDPIHLARISILALCCALMTQRNPSLSGFPTVVAIWALVFAPAIELAGIWGYWPEPASTNVIARWAITDIGLSLLAGALLLSQDFWVSLTLKPRRRSLSQILIHTLTLTAFATMLASFALPQLGLAILTRGNYSTDATSWMLAITFAVVVPALASVTLSKIIASLSHEFASVSRLSPNREASFSGLSSSFWRRTASGEIERANHENSGSSGNNQVDRAGSNNSSPLTPDKAICAIDNLGTIHFVNRRFIKQCEIKDSEVIGRKIDSISMHPTLRDAMIGLVTNTQRVGPHACEVRLNALPDNLRYFELRSNRADSLEGSALGTQGGDIIITVSDITDRRALETQLLQAQRLSSLGNFISGIGHSFNNYLMAIIGKSSLAQRATNSDARAAALKDITEAAWHAAEQVTKLVSFAEGQPSLLRDCDAGKLLREHHRMLQDMLGARYELTISGREELGINCDPNLILQAVTNLVINSRDAYGKDGGRIEIELEIEKIEEDVSALHIGAKPGVFSRMRVRDFGAGMSQDILARAFDPLFTTKRSRGNTGLGLSTVYAITRAHDGFLTVESSPNKGTTISLYLPYRQLSIGKETGVEINPTKDTTEMCNAKILVVEDEDQIREVIVKMLGSLGYQVSGCSSGVDALDRCKNDSFDLLLVDVALPQMAGPALIQRLREMNNCARALLMTGHSTAVASEIATPCISKPFDMETLATEVKTALSSNTTTT